jgi:hypothetical protein
MARFDGGWIKLHRSIALSDIGQNGHCLAILVTILIWASRFPSTVRWKGRAREIPAGSVLVGIRELATHLRFSKDTVYRQLSYSLPFVIGKNIKIRWDLCDKKKR